MKVLITGGTGFFGKALLEHLLKEQSLKKKGLEVTILSRNPEKFRESNARFTTLPNLRVSRGNILEKNTFPSDSNFTHIIHAAADSTLGLEISPLERIDQIVVGTRNLLEFSVEKNIDRFLYISSGGVYGKQPLSIDCINENSPGQLIASNTANTYGIAKLTAEHLCHIFRVKYNINTIIARCFSFVGPDLPLNAHFAIGNFIYDALYSESINILGDGCPLRTYLDQSDLAIWLLKLLIEGIPGETYNVGSDQVVSISELAYIVRDLLSPGKPVNTLARPQIRQERDRYVPDITKAKMMHDLKVYTSLEDSIINTGNFHKRNQCEKI